MKRLLTGISICSLSFGSIFCRTDQEFFRDFNKIEQEFEQTIGSADMNNLSIQEDQNAESYEITIPLSGFKQKDLKISIEKIKEGKEHKRRLEIHGSKEQEKARKNVSSSNEYHQYKKVDINGISNEKRIDYKDGKLAIVVDLPNSVDDENYTMVFKDDTLTITFPQKKSISRQKKELQFS